LIKTSKKLSFKYKDLFAALLDFRPLRIAVNCTLGLFLYILLPVYLIFAFYPPRFFYLFIFYLVNLASLFYLFRKNSARKHKLDLKAEDVQEKINLLNIQYARGIRNQAALQEKVKRYNSLKSIIEDVSQNLALEAIANNLSEITFSLIPHHLGTCILYLVDPKTHKLSLFKTKKEDKKIVIKAKEGDAFDMWVLRHSSPLIVEDVKKDFRFDPDKLKTEDARKFLSLISAPLISENKFLGILRLDSPEAGFYSQDDLRFLVTISELGAIALENGELFQKMQDLAIHDGLTLLYTKGYFLERLKEECKRSVRQNAPLSLLMLDIDHFKNYNDTFGHTAGDIVLKKISLDISDFLKEASPVISRFGGEEFCIVLTRTDKEKAGQIAEQLRSRIEKTRIVLRRQETKITVSIGVSTLGQDTHEEDELIMKADQAMYAAKQKGRNRVCTA
jgi:diguanylate cyclase (GGDEF)-like protein